MFKDYTEREAYVTVRNYSDGDKDGIINVYLNNEIIKKSEIKLKGGEDKTLRIDNLSSSGILKAELETNDFLSVDNTAYAIVNEIKPIKILLVSNDNKLESELEKIQSSTHRIRVTRIKTTDYAHDIAQKYDVAIFHEYVPNLNPAINSLYVFPPLKTSYPETGDANRDNAFYRSLFTIMRVIKNTRILDWDKKHPVMRHLENMDDLTIRSAIEMKPPEWSNSIIKVAGTPMDSTIAFAGKFEGKRVIALGFDVGDFDFSESKNLKVLIMVLNVIQWLNPYEVEENLKMLTGRQYIANYIMQGEYELMDPKGEIHKYSFENNSKENVLLNTIEYAGEYVVTGANVKRVFVANLFDDKESDIRLEPAEKKELNFEASETTTSVVAKKSEFGKYLLLCTPFILLLEWLLYYKKVREGTA